MPQQVFIVEWRHSGHRLAYVAGICQAAVAGAHDVVLVTTESLIASLEFGTHLRRFPELGVEIRNELQSHTHLAVFKIARDVRRRGGLCVFPECDRLLLTLCCAWISRSLPRPSSLIFMQPPKSAWRGLSAAAWCIVKPVLILSLMHSTRTVDVHLIEDPLAGPNERVWSGRLGAAHHRLDDPGDLLGSECAELPPELARLAATKPVVGVIGALDERTRIPAILDAWRASKAHCSAHLVVAGRQLGPVRDQMLDVDPALQPSVTAIDRYLTNGELYTLLRRCSCILVLYDRGISSGVLIAAASAGRWVITATGTRIGRVAAAAGLGISTPIAAESLASAIEVALAHPEQPRPLHLKTSLDFGRQVLRLARSDR